MQFHRPAVAAVVLSLVASVAAAAPKPPARKAPAQRKPAAKKPAPKKPAPKPTADAEGPRLDDHPLIAKLTPLPSGPGVLVCEPVSSGDDSLAAFGAGCGRWLHLVVGGHPELGKTPLWSSVEHTQRDLRKPDLRLSLEEAALLPESLGITHAAVGEIQGDAKSCKLVYRLYRVPGKQPVGEAVAVSGTEEEVRAALPGMAAGLGTLLGVKEPRVPAAVGETADELRQLGALPWVPDDTLSPAAASELREYLGPSAGRPVRPVLGLFLDMIARAASDDGAGVQTIGAALTAELPDNALVLAELGKQAGSVEGFMFMGLPQRPLDERLRRFPNSYLLHTARAYYRSVVGDPHQGRESAEQAVRCARGNPTAWVVLGQKISGQARVIRRGRFVSDMTEAELDQCGRYYVEWVPVALKAVAVSPGYARAWRELSTAAAFAGALELADAAFGRAISLDPTDVQVLSWGAQLYQPKWLDDQGKLAKVGQFAAAAADGWSSKRRLQVAIGLLHGDLPVQAKKVLRTDEEREALKKHLTEHPH